MILDRLPVIYTARPMQGHRQVLNIPAFRRPPVGKASKDKAS